MILSEQPRETSLAEVLQALEDVELNLLLREYRIDPLNPLVPLRRARVLKTDYQYRFSEPYLDPDAFPNNPMPGYMADSLFRVGAALLDYMISIRADTKMPQLTCYDILHEQREELKAAGYEVFKYDFSAEFGSEILAVRTCHGLLWMPLDVIEMWVQELNLSVMDGVGA